jgi:hypothetical protein
VKSTGYPLHSPVSPSLPLPCVTMYPHISTGLYLRHILHKNYSYCSQIWLLSTPRWPAGSITALNRISGTVATFSFLLAAASYSVRRRLPVGQLRTSSAQSDCSHLSLIQTFLQGQTLSRLRAPEGGVGSPALLLHCRADPVITYRPARQ